MKDARERFMRLPITSLAEAERALAILKSSSAPPIEVESAEYVVSILSDIESSQEFKASHLARSIVQPGHQHKSIYVVQARRGFLGIKSYCINFSIGLRSEDGNSQISRVESASLSVSPHPLSLTVVAVLASAAGAAIRHLTTIPENIDPALIVDEWPKFLVAALTALIVFNVFDLTNLRDQLRARVSWRLAILVGFLCGYLTDRILSALEALLG